MLRVRIRGSDDYSCDARLNDRLGAGPRSTVGRAWFQRHVEGRPLCVVTLACGISKSLDLGVGFPGAMMPATTNDT